MTTFHHALRRRFVFHSLAAWLAAGSMATAAVPAALAQEGSGAAAASRTPTGKVPAAVSVLSIVEHPSLDALRDGLHDELKDAGYQDGKSLHWAYQSAQGNQGTAVQIARKFVGDRPFYASEADSPVLTMTGGTITGNTAGSAGGGLGHAPDSGRLQRHHRSHRRADRQIHGTLGYQRHRRVRQAGG